MCVVLLLASVESLRLEILKLKEEKTNKEQGNGEWAVSLCRWTYMCFPKTVDMHSSSAFQD